MQIHPTADVQSTSIGKGTSIWQFCVVLPEARIGNECNICSHCFVENDVIVGDRVTVKCGVQLWDGIRLEDDVFVGPNVTFTNDRLPRSKQYPDQFAETVVKRGASIGAGATILPGVTIGKDAMVGAGSVVTSDVPPGTVVAGCPATIRRYVDQQQNQPATSQSTAQALTIDGAQWLDFKNVKDLRGNLTVVQWNEQLPFEPKRIFFVHGVPNEKVRGEHAHKECIQVFVCFSGTLHVVLDDGQSRNEVRLDQPSRGLLVPAGIWTTQYRFESSAVLAVFASHDYDENDYIRDYDKFLSFRRCD